jgi:hypothetical protein
MGHFSLDIREILNSSKIQQSIDKIKTLYAQFVSFIKISFFKIWKEFDKQMMRHVREFESKMKWGRDSLYNPRFLAVKYGLDSKYDLIFSRCKGNLMGRVFVVEPV